MISQPITIDLPVPLYDRLKERAAQSHNTVEEQVLEVVTAAIPLTEELDAEQNDALAQLTMLDDEALLRAARTRLATEISTELERLHVKRQREGITPEEQEHLRILVRQYERTMLVRAQAALLLQQRGFDLSVLGIEP